MAETELHDRHQYHVAATYGDYTAAEAAVRRLLERDIPVANISLVGQNFTIHEKPMGFTTIGGVAAQGAKFGAMWAGVLGLLVGFTAFFTPVAGPLLLFGPLAYALTTAVEGAAFGGLAGLLIGWGLAREKAIRFQRSVEAGQYLVSVSGDADLVGRATLILQATGPESLERFDRQGQDDPQAAPAQP
jgi:hypothetical protein